NLALFPCSRRPQCWASDGEAPCYEQQRDSSRRNPGTAPEQGATETEDPRRRGTAQRQGPPGGKRRTTPPGRSHDLREGIQRRRNLVHAGDGSLQACQSPAISQLERSARGAPLTRLPARGG